MREVFLDVGELGWSLYLSAHIRWLKRHTQSFLSVMVLPGREVLYHGLADKIFLVPDCFFTDFNMNQQNRFTFKNLRSQRLRGYFDSKLPKGYFVSRTQPLDEPSWKKVFVGRMLFRPYATIGKYDECGHKEIHVFPRCRKSKYFNLRNLPIEFYKELLHRLCEEFENDDTYIIRTMGIKSGAYDIDIDKKNYVNFLDRTSFADLIEGAKTTICAIGSQSAPLKLMLLQGVPSFMIGHEKKRHTKIENWMNTKAGFYEIGKNGYNDFYSPDCIDKIVEFIK